MDKIKKLNTQKQMDIHFLGQIGPETEKQMDDLKEELEAAKEEYYGRTKSRKA